MDNAMNQTPPDRLMIERISADALGRIAAAGISTR
jgi:hypothetical protein